MQLLIFINDILMSLLIRKDVALLIYLFVFRSNECNKQLPGENMTSDNVIPCAIFSYNESLYESTLTEEVITCINLDSVLNLETC